MAESDECGSRDLDAFPFPARPLRPCFLSAPAADDGLRYYRFHEWLWSSDLCPVACELLHRLSVARTLRVEPTLADRDLGNGTATEVVHCLEQNHSSLVHYKHYGSRPRSPNPCPPQNTYVSLQPRSCRRFQHRRFRTHFPLAA